MLVVEESTNSDTLVIAATGFARKLNLPVPEFFEKAGLSDAARLIITDRTRLHTLDGLESEFSSFFQFLDYLRGEVRRISPTQLICVGTSGGAHTALLLGHLLKAQQVVAFSPYPYLSIKQLEARKDPALRSMGPVVRRLDNLPDDVKPFFDLAGVLSSWNSVTRYHVHVSRYLEWDFRRAQYLKGLPGVEIVAHPYHVHAVVSPLARHGKLARCFQFPYRAAFHPMDAVHHMEGIASFAMRKVRGLVRR
jgi:hypothetical protein